MFFRAAILWIILVVGSTIVVAQRSCNCPCNVDNCLQGLAGTSIFPATVTVADCMSYLWTSVTITEPVITETVTATAIVTLGQSAAAASIVPVPSNTSIRAEPPSSETNTGVQKRQVPSIPAYASACSDSDSYVSACSCIGIAAGGTSYIHTGQVRIRVTRTVTSTCTPSIQTVTVTNPTTITLPTTLTTTLTIATTVVSSSTVIVSGQETTITVLTTVTATSQDVTITVPTTVTISGQDTTISIPTTITITNQEVTTITFTDQAATITVPTTVTNPGQETTVTIPATVIVTSQESTTITIASQEITVTLPTTITVITPETTITEPTTITLPGQDTTVSIPTTVVVTSRESTTITVTSTSQETTVTTTTVTIASQEITITTPTTITVASQTTTLTVPTTITTPGPTSTITVTTTVTERTTILLHTTTTEAATILATVSTTVTEPSTVIQTLTETTAITVTTSVVETSFTTTTTDTTTVTNTATTTSIATTTATTTETATATTTSFEAARVTIVRIIENEAPFSTTILPSSANPPGTVTVLVYQTPSLLPDTSCNNANMEVGLFNHPFRPPQYQNIPLEYFATNTPYETKATGNYSLSPGVVASHTYTSPFGMTPQNINVYGLMLRGWFYAPKTQLYTFRADDPDDILGLWVGVKALSRWATTNANLRTIYTGTGTTSSYQISLPAGSYTPIRILLINTGGPAKFGYNVFGADNVYYIKSDVPSNYTVQRLCEGDIPFRPWGEEVSIADKSCGNDGWEVADYEHPFAYTQASGFTNYNVTYFKTKTPYNAGSTNITGLSIRTNELPPGLSSRPSGATGYNYRGYFYAPYDDTYKFAVGAPDNRVDVWMGELAYSGWLTNNTNITGLYTFTLPPPVSVYLTAGTYFPVRLLLADDGGTSPTANTASYQLNITDSVGFQYTPPGGVPGIDMPFMISKSCDGLSPAYPPFGAET
ncbi:hypothetical protein H072_8762 [Dactylellina haptotyla CBS 200.50]|uniref:PA14 domain-containing protein n=1 Tax=Dactylellina haptotyla (strain CBS 200.50) TaxID=1284197 RepID=S8A3B1_DACHA|nr:hypothetical protein H072_8762 [Dactylellina haptotyla CBS 200.50]